MTDLTTIRDLADPAERARQAEEHARAVKAKADQHRARRNMAMLAAIDAGEKKATVYKSVGVCRSTLVKIEKSAPAELPEVADPLVTAIAEQEALAVLDAEVRAAQQIRDAAVLDLLLRNGVPNHQVVEDTGLSSVRVAQLRAAAFA